MASIFIGQVSLAEEGPTEPSLPSLEPPPLPELVEPVPMPEPEFPEEASEPSPLEAGGALIVPRPLPPFWECQLPTGSFLVRVSDMVTVSQHEFVRDNVVKVVEVTISTRSAVVARFYYEEVLVNESRPMSEPLVEGRLALRRAEALILAGKHVRHKEVQEYGLPVQWSEDIAVAPAVVYRLRRKADVIALYESARSAWRDGVEGVFSVAE